MLILLEKKLTEKKAKVPLAHEHYFSTIQSTLQDFQLRSITTKPSGGLRGQPTSGRPSSMHVDDFLNKTALKPTAEKSDSSTTGMGPILTQITPAPMLQPVGKIADTASPPQQMMRVSNDKIVLPFRMKRN